jgi:DNA-directed RNA polymerase specialized sigma24 family protein
MKREFPDFHAIRPEHQGIHDSLLNWVRVVRDSQFHTRPQPMFRYYRSAEVWITPDPQIPTDSEAGWKMERSIRNLPEKHREAIRWHYVRRTDPRKQARILAVTVSVLSDLVHDGRSMLKNRSL